MNSGERLNVQDGPDFSFEPYIEVPDIETAVEPESRTRDRLRSSHGNEPRIASRIRKAT